MSVTLLGSPENRRVLRAVAIERGIISNDVDPGFEVRIGTPTYRQIVPLSKFPAGSRAWAAEMLLLEASLSAAAQDQDQDQGD